MKLYRIYALFSRYMKILFNDFSRIIDFFYWPFVDMVVFGFTSKWMENSSNSKITVMLLSGLILWQAANRANMEVSYGLIEELWSKNVVNLFVTPITLSEWIVAVMSCGIIKAIFSVIYSAIIVWLIYSINFFDIGLLGIPLFLLLILTGWIMGFFAASIIIYSGQRYQSFVWMAVWLFSLISAVYYPVDVLPVWVQLVSKLFPAVYIFEGMRDFYSTGIWPLSQMLTALTLNIIYLVLILILFKIIFEKSRAKGLARLEVE